MSGAIFPSARVIPSEDVLGRGGFLRELEERLFLGDSCTLIAPRRTGKTSVACEVQRRLRERGCYTIYVDLFGFVSEKELGLRLIQKVQQVFELGRDELVCQEDALDEALDVAERTTREREKRMIITFDEWQEIDRIGGETLLKRLRSIVQHQNHVSYLFLSSEPSTMRTLFADRRQAFYRFATMLHLPDISGDEWNDYVHRKFDQAAITIDDDAFEELMKSSGGHPYDMMAILREVEMQLRLGKKDHVTLSLVQSSIFALSNRSLS